MTRRAALACFPALLGALDFGLLTAAAPGIAAELDVGAAYGWLFSAGSLAYGAVVMPSEALLGSVPPSRLLAVGLAVAAAGLLAVAAAEDVTTALGGRVLFGGGSGAVAAAALVLLAEQDGGDAPFSRMGGAISLGFSSGVLLGMLISWRAAVAAIAALTLAAACAAVVTTQPPRGDRVSSSGALRLGAATAAVGAFLALVHARPIAAGIVLAAALVLAASAWHDARARPRVEVLVPCAAGAATTMSGVGAMVVLSAAAEGAVLTLFGLGTFFAVAAARRLEGRLGAPHTAIAGLVAQAIAVLALPFALVPAIVAFGTGHVIANAGAAAAVMRTGEPHAAGLYATAQYVAAGVGALVVPTAGMAAAAAIALAGAATVASAQRGAATQSARRSA